MMGTWQSWSLKSAVVLLGHTALGSSLQLGRLSMASAKTILRFVEDGREVIMAVLLTGKSMWNSCPLMVMSLVFFVWVVLSSTSHGLGVHSPTSG